MLYAKVTLKLDHASIKRKIEKAFGQSLSVKRAAYKRGYDIYRSAKRAMLAEFDRHLVTQEIKGGPEAANISDTLDGYGNLFSFIGFHEGDHPTEPLRWLLEQTPFEQTIYSNRKWYFRIGIPSIEDIALATPMPWEIGNSWALAVENYISGLSHYMYKRSEASRSSQGIQLPHENWGEDIAFRGKSYITEILQHFRERINEASA